MTTPVVREVRRAGEPRVVLPAVGAAYVSVSVALAYVGAGLLR